MFANRVIGGYTVPCVALYIVVVVAIILYGYFLRRTKMRDPLSSQIYHHPVCQQIDGWSVTHFVFFGILGLLYPGQHLQFLAVGIFWEIVESALGQNDITVSGNRLQLVGETGEDGVSTNRDDAYWYGKESDIVVDITAYTLGSFFADRYWPNDKTSRAAAAAAAAPPRAAAAGAAAAAIAAPPRAIAAPPRAVAAPPRAVAPAWL